ncbi:hypothetical protein BLA29_000480 [Euroglyphus maynei]|uniref:Uncharacterized protein n=1 Tax=Euroglyphus maynei TaxID=6958 RepID=A0A1Y3B844_EURMA|nr:hypothetical protein BLA29_000480 [Euroglyphus maynei]
MLSNNLLDEMIDKASDSSKTTRLNFILFNECSLCYIEQNSADHLMATIIEFIEHRYSSSYSISIQYLGYEMYNSIGSQNNFIQFMLNHFGQLNAPIRTFLDENQIRERFVNLNFNQINVINMRNFYRELLSYEDHDRINHIESFDEWEELENVCQVYCLTICKKFKSSSSNEFNHLISSYDPQAQLLAKSFRTIQQYDKCIWWIWY